MADDHGGLIDRLAERNNTEPGDPPVDVGSLLAADDDGDSDGDGTAPDPEPETPRRRPKGKGRARPTAADEARAEAIRERAAIEQEALRAKAELAKTQRARAELERTQALASNIGRRAAENAASEAKRKKEDASAAQRATLWNKYDEYRKSFGVEGTGRRVNINSPIETLEAEVAMQASQVARARTEELIRLAVTKAGVITENASRLPPLRRYARLDGAGAAWEAVCAGDNVVDAAVRQLAIEYGHVLTPSPLQMLAVKFAETMAAVHLRNVSLMQQTAPADTPDPAQFADL